MKVEIKIGEQEGLLSFNSQTFLIEDFKDTLSCRLDSERSRFFCLFYCVFGGSCLLSALFSVWGLSLFFVLLVLF